MTHSDGAPADGLQQAVDALATRLERSVAVDDTHGGLVAASRHFGDEDPLRVHAVLQRSSDARVLAHFEAHGIHRWRTPGRVPADPELGFKARVCCPVFAHGIAFGHLFLIDDGVEDAEVELAAAAAAEIGELMYRRLVLHEHEHGRREALARDLVSDDAGTRAAARRAVVDEHLVEAVDPVLALSVRLLGATARGPDAPGTALRVAFDRLARGGRRRVLTAADGYRGTVLLAGGSATDAVGRETGRRLVADLARTDGVERVVVGLGEAGTGAEAASRSRDGARVAADAAALVPALGDVVAHGELGAYALLLAVPRHALTADLYPAPLRRLLEKDNDSLVDTLETYLDCCGDATRSAAALRVHRSTLHYRLGRIEAVAGVDLHDGTQRLALHLGVKLHRLLAGTPSAPDPGGP